MAKEYNVFWVEVPDNMLYISVCSYSCFFHHFPDGIFVVRSVCIKENALPSRWISVTVIRKRKEFEILLAPDFIDPIWEKLNR